jgi:hypothetical protein
MKRGWEDNIKMDLKEIGWNRLDWIHMAEDRDKEASSCGHVRRPFGSGVKFLDQLRGYWFLKMEFPERY